MTSWDTVTNIPTDRSTAEVTFGANDRVRIAGEEYWRALDAEHQRRVTEEMAAIEGNAAVLGQSDGRDGHGCACPALDAVLCAKSRARIAFEPVDSDITVFADEPCSCSCHDSDDRCLFQAGKVHSVDDCLCDECWDHRQHARSGHRR